jgi:uncharacterized protein YjbI with pentapeptide repeats
MKRLNLWIKSSAARLKPLTPWAVGLGGGLLLALLLWFLLAKIPQRNIPSLVDEDIKRRADLVNSNRENVLKIIQTLAGLGFFGTAYLTWHNYQLTEDKNVTDRFTKAVEMLADEKLEMRLGGIYSLERIAKDSKEDHLVVMEVLTAFIREKTTSQEYGKPDKPTADIQSALTVIGRRNTDNDSQRLNLSGCHLQGAILNRANLQEAELIHANLHKAILEQANLQKAHLNNANLQGADLNGANLQKAFLLSANLQGAKLMDTNLQGAYLRSEHYHQGENLIATNLQEAFLFGANLQQADLENANLQEASLFGASLQGANLMNTNLQGANLDSAKLQGAHLFGAKLQGANLFKANLKGTKLREDKLDQAILCKTLLPEGIKLNPDRDCPKELA